MATAPSCFFLALRACSSTSLICQRRTVATLIRQAQARRRWQRADSARWANLKKRLLVSDVDAHVRFTLLDQLQHAPLRRRHLPVARTRVRHVRGVPGRRGKRERSSKRNRHALVPYAPCWPPSRRGLRRVHDSAPLRRHGGDECVRARSDRWDSKCCQALPLAWRSPLQSLPSHPCPPARRFAKQFFFN